MQTKQQQDRRLFEEAGQATATPPRPVEVEVVDSVALAPRQVGAMAPGDAPPVAALAMMEDALAITERMAAVVVGLRRAAIGMTDPADWILNRDKQGVEVGMMAGSGAQKVASLYGIGLVPLAGAKDLEPARIQIAGKLAFNLKCRAFSRLLGREVEIEATRREDEEFTGRETDDAGDLKFKGGRAYEPDLKKSVRTLALTTAVRELVGLKNVSRQELDDAWKGSAKESSRCRFGHGYGTSQDRSAGTVTDGDVKTKAKELGDEILRRVGGDTDAAKTLLREITQNKEGKYGKDSIAQFTKGEQVEWAWNKLRSHPIHGDGANE